MDLTPYLMQLLILQGSLLQLLVKGAQLPYLLLLWYQKSVQKNGLDANFFTLIFLSSFHSFTLNFPFILLEDAAPPFPLKLERMPHPASQDHYTWQHLISKVSTFL